MKFTLSSIGEVKSPYKEKFGTPRQPGLAKEVTAEIIFSEPFNTSQAFEGLEGFSYIWVQFYFHLLENYDWTPKVRPPRLGGNIKKGVFATRSPNRPNPIGLSLVKLIEVVTLNDKVTLKISGHDLVDGTPVLDIKPYLPAIENINNANDGWVKEIPEEKHLDVNYSQEINAHLSEDTLLQVCSYLKLDPRPSYHNDERVYKNKFMNFDISWKLKNGKIIILEVKQI